MNRLWKSDLQNGKYINPILFADYSDPDVIRVGDTYYMTASSFSYTPGLPILTSKDLVNWELVNYAVENIDAPGFELPRHSNGIWAPAIRYHKGIFYIIYGMPDDGFYVVKTKDPLGKWDKPVLLLEGRGLIDPCMLWDDDGRTYVIHGYAKSRIGFNSMLGIFEVNEDCTKVLSEDHIIFDGHITQHTIEGPKVYKRNGLYYILAPAGGVRTGWQTALRSASINGPYEEMIVMAQGSSDINGPHQGGLVDTVNGDEWFIHFQDMGAYGRVCLLQPVTWKDGWPSMGINIKSYCGEPVREYSKPNTGASSPATYLQASDSFESDTLSLCWQWTGNHSDDFYSLSDNPGKLTLNAVNTAKDPGAVLWNRPNVLTQKVVCPSFEAETKLDYSNLTEGGEAGLVMMGGDYALIKVRIENGSAKLFFVTSFQENTDKKEKEVLIETLPENTYSVTLYTSLTDKFEMHYDNGLGKTLVKESLAFRPVDHTWVGAKPGLFANSVSNSFNSGSGIFEYFEVKEING